ncbi:MAG: tetratricopeptide repeat protein [Pseudanabaena sp.]|jgi:tetratricopeptide (TPR) repeat protein
MEQNEVNFLDLLVAIETSNKHLSLLLAVCDRDRLRNSLTERYEQELASEGIKSYRVTIDRQEPSLFAAINQLVEAESYLQAGNPAVITVEGVVSLSSFTSEDERSPVDKFLGYLQWTREGMRQFAFPIVIWVTEHIHNEISRKAQDFYSWRQGVFFFEAIQEESIVPIDVEPIDLQDPESDDLDLPIDELLVYIAQREADGQEDASLATFYTLLARAYERDNQIDQAISTWQKTINLQQKLNLSLELATSLNSLGTLYLDQGKYTDSESIFQKSLQLKRELLGDRHPDVATSLNNLAGLYELQGRYEKAELLHLEAMQLRRELLGDRHPDVAQSLNNLALLYNSQGRYEEAEPLYLEAIQLMRELLGDRHLFVATSLNNLALLYNSQGRYEEAEPLYLEAIQLMRELLDDRHPNVTFSLNNLAELYRLQGRYEEAEPLYLEAMQLRRELFGDRHRNVATSLNNLAGLYHSQGRYEEAELLYLEAIQLMRELLGDRHPLVATSLNNLAGLYRSQGRYEEAEPLYQEAMQLRR